MIGPKKEKLNTNFYFDGFSFYYGCVKDSAWKWLDLAALCNKVYPNLRINRIRYFTARVRPIPTDPNVPHRQQIYLRALRTIPDISIHFGFFQSNPKWQPLADPPLKGLQSAHVINTEEKGSDVKLASYLLLDGFRQDYEVAIVISNDSDLAEPIRLVRGELRLPVGVLAPTVKKGRRPSAELKRVSDPGYYRVIHLGALKACQFPPSLNDAKGWFFKPKSW